jgi:hypothetical protein
LEYRSPAVPLDDWDPTDPAVTGVSIRIVPFQSNASAHILDMTPGDNNFTNAPLTLGTFYDPYSKISITVQSRTSTYIKLQIKGLLQATSPGLSITKLATPVISTGGQVVTLSGTGFGTGTRVKVDGKFVTTIVNSGTQLTFAAPASTAKSSTVSVVTNQGQTVNKSAALTYCNAAIKIGPPTNVQATSVTANSVSLKWTPPVPAAGGCPVQQYNIYRYANGTSGQSLSSTGLSPTTTAYTDTTAQPGVAYTYYVYVLAGTGNYTYSAPISVTTPAGSSSTQASRLPSHTSGTWGVTPAPR